jgi:hypothetical protein
MSFWKLIKGIRFKQLISLFGFSLKHPLLMFATIKATSHTMKIVQEKFPDIHGKDNKANAFRHAFWNYMIAVKCSRKEKHINAIISWTKEITDWHEDFSPNEPLARAMDLHNNHIGRELFQNHPSKTEREVINVLESRLIDAIQVNSCEEIEKHSINLVFINQD